MTAETAREMLRPLLRKARDEKKWLWCRYQDLWFSPDELDAHHDEGRFLWGPNNWGLRDPAERIKYLRRDIERAMSTLSNFQKRIELSFSQGES